MYPYKLAYVERNFSLFRSETANNRRWEEQDQFVYFSLSKAVNSKSKTPTCYGQAQLLLRLHRVWLLEHNVHFSALFGPIHIQEIYTTSCSNNKAN